MDVSEYYLRRILVGGPVPMSCAARGAVSYSAPGVTISFFVCFRLWSSQTKYCGARWFSKPGSFSSTISDFSLRVSRNHSPEEKQTTFPTEHGVLWPGRAEQNASYRALLPDLTYISFLD